MVLYVHVLYQQVYSLSAWTCSDQCDKNSTGGSGCGLVGMLVAEVQGLDQLEGEGTIALESTEVNTTALYVISLG